MATGEFKIGKMNAPKPAVYMAGAAAVGIVAYAYYKRRGNTATATDTTGTTTDPSIDPSTGIPWADEMGYGSSAGYTGASGLGIYDPTTGQYYNNGYGNQVVTAVTTNAAWAQAAEAYLTSIGQYDPAAVAAAIGKALTGQYVTSDQVAIFAAARAFEGEPPTGYPPLNTHPPVGQPGGTGTVTGKGPVTNLKVTNTGQGFVSLDWSPVSGAKAYALDVNGKRSVTVYYSNGTVSGLSRKHHYTVGVTPIKSDGKLGTRKTISATTK
jgi:hypothetical protein